jgi:lysyl-tRNA synthetase class I
MCKGGGLDMALTVIERNGLVEKVLSLSLTKSTREISKILEEEDGVSITFKTVANFIKAVRQERAEATKALVQESIQATVPQDLKILDELIAQQLEWFRDGSMDTADRLNVSKELRQVIATKLKYSGAEEPATVNLTFESRLESGDDTYEY